MVGQALVRALSADPRCTLITRTRHQLDLCDQAAVEQFFATERPTQVYLAAARVGGIQANSHYPAEFIYQNLMIASHVIHAAWRYGVERLLFLGSSCIYPRLAAQPMAESALLTGALEPTNEPYAIAKIAGIKLCESYNRQYDTDFRSLMPTNLYGPGDHFDLNTSHVLPALIRKCHEAKTNQQPQMVIWGSGQARREFLHVDDLAAACLHVMGLSRQQYRTATEPMCSHLNVGSGSDLSIRELAEIIQQVVGYEGDLRYDSSKPDGAPQKLLISSKLQALGWCARIELVDGIRQTYQWYLKESTPYG